MNKTFVISLGGSLIFPENINADFLKNFKLLLEKQIRKGRKFIVVTGGGKICRHYQDALKKAGKPSKIDLDWMGIHSTYLNAHLLRLIFKKYSHPYIRTDIYNKKISFKEKILVAGGYKPGRSSDGAMVQIAKTFGAPMVINLSNIDYVYTKDPKKFEDAKPITQISWKNFRKIIGNKWDPGANVPFDPTAAKIAEDAGITVIIANGKNLKNLENIFQGKKFFGTIIN